MDILCRNLAVCGLLRKRGKLYRASRFAATVLNARHQAYRGAYLDLLKSQWQDWSRLTEAVRSGHPVDRDEQETPDYRRQFSWAMHHRSLEVAARVARQLDLGRARSILDLGGGPGTYALAFMERHPRLSATLCDRAAALEVAKDIAANHPARKRLMYLPLDFMSEPIPGRFDVVWYSNVLHIYSPEENLALFHRVLNALAPGGTLIIQDAFLHGREDLHSEEASLFAVSMLLFTERGNTYPFRETAAWLRKAGYVKVRPIVLKRGTGDWEGGIVAASRPIRPRERSARRRP